jgi:hypothetical protein
MWNLMASMVVMKLWTHCAIGEAEAAVEAGAEEEAVAVRIS